jgi:hypothetical protein
LPCRRIRMLAPSSKAISNVSLGAGMTKFILFASALLQLPTPHLDL